MQADLFPKEPTLSGSLDPLVGQMAVLLCVAVVLEKYKNDTVLSKSLMYMGTHTLRSTPP